MRRWFMMRRAGRRTAMAMALGLGLLSAGQAADWPERPVRLLVPATPGATPDVFARILAEKLQERLGQPVVVDNKPGAGGAIAVQAVAKARPDGYTIGISPPGPLGVNRLLYKKMLYDPDKELALVTIAVTQSNVLAVSPSLKVANVQDLVALVRQQPGKYTYATVGLGSVNHLCMELLAINSATQITQVAYSGTPQALMALVGGEVDMGCLPAQAVMPQVKVGKVRALAVATARRSPFLPEVPTLTEAGIAGIEASSWMGVVAPAGTPPAVVKRLGEEIAQVLQLPDAKSRLASQLMEVVSSTPEQFATTVREDLARWKPVIESRRIQLE